MILCLHENIEHIPLRTIKLQESLDSHDVFLYNIIHFCLKVSRIISRQLNFAYCPILRISFVIKYVYMLLVFYHLGLKHIFISIFLDRCPYVVGNRYIILTKK